MRHAFEAVEDKAGGIFRFAYTHGSDIFVGSNGLLQEVRQEWNISEIPGFVLWPAGPKTLKKGHPFPAQATLGLAQAGTKNIYNSFRTFVASLVTDVRGSNFGAWLQKPAPALPRMLLFSDKKDTSLQLRELSVATSSRVVIAQSGLSDGLAAAFGISSGPALFLSPRSPYAALVGKGAAAAGTDAKAAAAALTASLESATPSTTWTRFTGNLSTVTYDDLFAFVSDTHPFAPVHLLSGPADFDSACGGGDVTVCFIAVLPHTEMLRARATSSAASAAHDDGVLSPEPWDVLQRVASRSYVRPDFDAMLQRRGPLGAIRMPLTFAAVDASTQPAFASSLKANNAPALIALNPRKRVFATLRDAAFTDSALHDFVLSALDEAPAVSSSGKAAAAAAAAGGAGKRKAAGGKGGDDEEDADAVKRVTFESLSTVPLLKQEAVSAPPVKAKAAAKGAAKGAASAGATKKKAAAAATATPAVETPTAIVEGDAAPPSTAASATATAPAKKKKQAPVAPTAAAADGAEL